MDQAYQVWSVVNQYIAISPLLAGAVAALAARAANPRVRWLVLAGCLIPFVSVIGSRVFRPSEILRGRSDDELQLAYDLMDLGEQLLWLSSSALFLLAMLVVFRSRRQPPQP